MGGIESICKLLKVKTMEERENASNKPKEEEGVYLYHSPTKYDRLGPSRPDNPPLPRIFRVPRAKKMAKDFAARPSV